MKQEIERKFLVRGEYKALASSSSYIEQGYIAKSEDLTLRIRTRDEQGFLTIKGRSKNGISRSEWEYEIPVQEARQLLSFSRGHISKRRYLVCVGKHTFEVDEFYGANEGLTVAEVELDSINEEFPRPEWLGEEVTGDKRYYNSQLLRHPYSEWQEK